MRTAYTTDQIRAAERPLLESLPDGALMRRAASGLAYAIAEYTGRTYGLRVLLLVGSGDNGGDALYAGAQLARRGVAVRAIEVADRVHAGGRAALIAAGGGAIAADRLAEAETTDLIAWADVAVDGIVGIGGRPGLREPAASIVAHLEALGTPVVAVDVPSGVSVNDGEAPLPHVTADLTVTFGAYKPCHLIDPAASACGAVELVEIGLDLPPARFGALLDVDVASRLPQPERTSDKYSRGVLAVVAGSTQYPGAGILTSGGALAAGAGMVRYLGPDSVADAVRSRHPEVISDPGRVQAWSLGSGLGRNPGRTDAVQSALTGEEPIVIDADGLSLLDGPLTGRPALLTPHAGELARLLDVDRTQVEAQRLASASQAADRFDAAVLLKGSTTLVVTPCDSHGKRWVRVHPHGCPWLSTAGSGDVLAGICGALLAAGLSPLDAGSVGASLHSLAGWYASGAVAPITALDVTAAVPTVWARLASGRAAEGTCIQAGNGSRR